MAAAMAWQDPDRGVGVPRGIALARLEAGSPVQCVWSGRVLDERSLDMDHCLPWSAWPCSDLWNVAPAHRRLNQHAKRGLLPSAELLSSAADRFASWWERSYLTEPHLVSRFSAEARASLPGLAEIRDDVHPEDILSGMALQRLRLRHDQGAPEWTTSPARIE